MIYNYRAFSLKALIKSFNHQASEKKHQDPFAKNWIVMQNREMQQWMSFREASDKGISANNDFIFPSELLWKLYRFIDPDLPRQLPSDRTPMHWQIFELLEKGELSFLDFVAEDQQSRFRFAGQLADVFDQYQVYRPDMLAAWEQGRMTTTLAKEEQWQHRVWKTLVAHWNKFYPDIPNRLQAQVRINSELEKGRLKEKLPDTITVFGLSHFSRPFADLIGMLSGYLDIHFYSLGYKSGTPWEQLQRDWAEMGRDAQVMLDELLSDKDGQLQQNEEVEHRSIIDRPESIHLHSCHNERREVEVLKDELLRKLDGDPQLTLNDIVLLVPDMESYAPWIESVFNAEEKGEPRIPVYIPDNYQSQVQNAFVRLLEFMNGRVTVSAFMDLITSDPILDKYDLSEDSVQKLKRWLIELHIHWGLEEKESPYSIEKALYSMISGYLMEPKPFTLWEGIAPLEQATGSETPQILSALSEVLRLLKKFRGEISEPRDALNWIKLFQQWSLSFLGDRDGDRIRLMHTLEQLEAGASFVKEGAKIPFSIMAHWTASQFSDTAASSNGLGNGLVVSTYIPYRSIPFKYIAILGLNEGVFPRNPVRPHFDLIQKEDRAGDRITKKDDRLLFWELLHATEDHLHLSYKGQDQHSEQEHLPSILVQRLTDELQLVKGFKLEARKHKLHGFAESYFDGTQSYSAERLSVLLKNRSSGNKDNPFWASEELINDPEDFDGIGLNQLISFFTHPSKYLCQNVLGLRYPYQENELEDREVFQLNQLHGYAAKDIALEGLLDRKDETMIRSYMDSNGLVPPGIHGEAELSKVFDQVRQLLQESGLLHTAERSSQEVDIDIDGIRLSGVVGNVYDDKLIHYRVGSTRAQDLIRLWLNHLALSSTGHSVRGELHTIKKGKTESTFLREVQKPKEILKGLLQWFVEAHTTKEALAFIPECSLAFHRALEKNDREKAIEKALQAWEGGWNSGGEGNDPYHSLIWSWEELLSTDSFTERSSIFWKPFTEHLSDGGKG